MPKGYWVALVDIKDPLRYGQAIEMGMDAMDRVGGRVIVRGTGEVRVGSPKTRVVIVEFESLAEARARFEEPSYQAARDVFADIAEYDLLIVEGLSDPLRGSP